MLLKMDTADSPVDEASVLAHEAIAFDVALLRQTGGAGEFKPVPLDSGTGPVLHVGDKVQLRFINQGFLDIDITVIQIDIPRGLTRDPRGILKALQGEVGVRAGLGQAALKDFAVRVIRFQIQKPNVRK
jgi:hypothetical protein